MKRPSIHPRATARTLAAARILVGLLWLVRLSFDPIHDLGHLPESLWIAPGLLRLLPDALMLVLLDPLGLTILRLLGAGLALLVVLGIRPHRLNLAVLTLLLVVYLGIGRGFGGHVNHRELVLLYVTFLLILLPCFDALAVQRSRRPVHRAEIYRSSMITICLVIATSYMFVGVARLSMGFPPVYEPEVMRGWLVNRSVRPGPVGLELGAAFLDLPISRYLIPLILPVSTILEISTPLALGLRQRWRIVLVASLAIMHMGIAALMNIVFIENVLLLVLFLDYTPWLDRLTDHRVRFVDEFTPGETTPRTGREHTGARSSPTADETPVFD